MEASLYSQSYYRIPAKIISFLLHPLFIPAYVFFWLLLRFPYQFAGITKQTLFFREFNVVWITAFFPAFSVFLLWRLGLIENIYLRTQKERIVPYIITMTFYWWMWYLSRNFTDQPEVLQYFYFGIFLTTAFGLVINSFRKISMHAMGIAGAFAFIFITCFINQTFLGFDICVVTFVTGLVCTSRFLLGAHSNGDVYGGLFVGILCQVIALIALR